MSYIGGMSSLDNKKMICKICNQKAVLLLDIAEDRDKTRCWIEQIAVCGKHIIGAGQKWVEFD